MVAPCLRTGLRRGHTQVGPKAGPQDPQNLGGWPGLELPSLGETADGPGRGGWVRLPPLGPA